MAKFLVPDSVAAEIHEREIPDHFVAGLPLHQAVAIIDAWDATNIEGDAYLNEVPESREYQEQDGTGILEVNTDRSHWYAIVYNPTDDTLARQAANMILDGWCPDEED